MDYNFNYPDLYYQIYPKVIEVVGKKLHTETGNMSQDSIEEMIDEIYIDIIKLYPEIDEDPVERRGRMPRYSKANKRYFYGRKKLLRDFISIILISELLRRISPYTPRQ